jgi:hypothetical protein
LLLLLTPFFLLAFSFSNVSAHFCFVLLFSLRSLIRFEAKRAKEAQKAKKTALKYFASKGKQFRFLSQMLGGGLDAKVMLQHGGRQA